MDIKAVSDRIRQDYATFPQDQSYDLYADDVFFQDPLNRFHGIERYRKMIHFIERWFQSPNLELHDLKITSESTFETYWTLSWITPLPWKPQIAVPGWTEYRLSDVGKIIAHVDYWNCSRLAVFGQVFGLGKPQK